MVSQADNARLTRVGPGTAMGNLLRRFWMPALIESELGGPDGPPLRLRLLGEDLVAFRDTAGRIGILEAACAHRRVSLYFGRNEECGLRCAYHGWKYDVEGNCIDIPSEPDGGAALKPLARRVAYPTAVRGGVVWVYMGPKDFAAAPPDFEWSLLPERQRTVTKRLQECNWAQAVEGGIDSAHVSFLHQRVSLAPLPQPRTPLLVADRRPLFEVKETRFGLWVAARREAGPDRFYWRITPFLLPFFQMIPPVVEVPDTHDCPYSGHAWVPIDDESIWTWSFGASPHRAYSDAELAFHGAPDGQWGPVDAHYRPLRHRGNDYGIDRAAQKQGVYSGIEGLANQDAAVQESMGAIVDRTREVLGTSDRAIVLFRRLMLRLAAALEAGQEPEAARHGDWYKVRAAAVVLDRHIPFEDGAAWLLEGATRAAAE
jgi:phthalate 4,5-dioxygenase